MDEHPAHERHTFRVVNQLNPSKHWEQHSLPYKEHRDPDGWGWGKFLSHEYLKEESQGYRINDTIIFELELYCCIQTKKQAPSLNKPSPSK